MIWVILPHLIFSQSLPKYRQVAGSGKQGLSLTKGKRRGPWGLQRGWGRQTTLRSENGTVWVTASHLRREMNAACHFPAPLAMLLNSHCAAGLSVLRWFCSPACVAEWGRAPEHVCWTNLHHRTELLEWGHGQVGILDGSLVPALPWPDWPWAIPSISLLLSLLKCKTNAFHQMTLEFLWI